MFRSLTVTSLLLSLVLGACSTSPAGGGVVPPDPVPLPGDPGPIPNPTPGPDPTPGPNPTPGDPVPPPPGDTTAQGFITGRIVNQYGQPVVNAEVVADNTLAYNSNLITHTDADGRYKISVNGMPTTFKVSAKITLNYPPYNPQVDLVPDGETVVPGNVGGVVNFTLKPGTSQYGNLGMIQVENGAGYFVDLSKVELTVNSVGTLADGSSGVSFKVKPTHLWSWYVINVMYGTYTVTATENGVPLDVRKKFDGGELYEWHSSFTGGFTKDMWAPNPVMNLQLRPHNDDPTP
ncbi:carboxypeptidase-like regulatory domain-containing protein [Deinococcus sp. HMF7604]|uniref:carboxypeptidase-like regulatory domain-containing protein n=1 Tax=Deinococcus betulae TaxID=2873312 RepID=UPI001CCDBB35|nr:carboxypeptidase-like regulatory domain-containing protein [Deinococcus betulae]MBZ9749855.1 carboxypeptidase-like regulatory domain-containing protein [Deinococcus betulae]